ncbi:MAG: hypothetical protein RBU37_21690, partial [Myxococcota bacterium]|nr:hypothetical protein [Myxococcota bacterium]
LAQLAIAATVFPRAADLEDDLDRPRPPLTVEEVEDLLRVLSERLEEENRDKPDPAVSDEAGGLLEAWRIYRRRAAAKDERFSRIGMRRIIEFGLERLRDFGCFVETQLGGKSAWQPTRRYNVMVQEFAASRLLEEVQRVLGYNAPMDEED